MRERVIWCSPLSTRMVTRKISTVFSREGLVTFHLVDCLCDVVALHGYRGTVPPAIPGPAVKGMRDHVSPPFEDRYNPVPFVPT